MKKIKWKYENDYGIFKDTDLWIIQKFYLSLRFLDKFAGFEEDTSDLLSDNQLIF